MRGLLLSATTLLVACALGACNSADSGSSRNSAAPSSSTSANAPANSAGNVTTIDNSNSNSLPVASTHGGGLTGAPPLRPGSGAAASSTGGAAEKPDIETKELDAKIEKAEAKAKQAGASEADRRVAARAYFDRGYLYYSAQNPKLYKFALGDFRRALRYQPDNSDARAIVDQIEAIYRQMGRPIPSNGLEQ